MCGRVVKVGLILTLIFEQQSESGLTNAGEKTEYTDGVDIKAGWKTPFIWIWAKAFYAHRQRKWIKLLKAL